MASELETELAEDVNGSDLDGDAERGYEEPPDGLVMSSIMGSGRFMGEDGVVDDGRSENDALIWRRAALANRI